MTLTTQRSKFGLKASLMAPVLAVGLLAAAPASAAGLGGVSALADIQADATSNILHRTGGHRRLRHRRHGRFARGHRARSHAYRAHRRHKRRSKRKAAIGIGLGILGAAIIANHHYNRGPKVRHYRRSHGVSPYRAAKRKCARVYGEDYVWRTDLVYDGYGDARVCKFVRRLH